MQSTFLHECKALTDVMQEFGNPFIEETNDLMVLDTKEIMGELVVATVKTIETLGQQQYSQFIEVERLFHCEKPLTDAITKNKLSLFSTAPTKSPSKGKLQLDSLKSDCNLFYRLYVTCQNRDGDLDRFFAHENSSTPPSLSQGGMLRTANKAELLTCLESGVDITSVNKYP